MAFMAHAQIRSYAFKKHADPVLICSGLTLHAMALRLQNHSQPLDTSNLDIRSINFADAWACEPQRPALASVSDALLLVCTAAPYIIAYRSGHSVEDRGCRMMVACEAQLLTSGLCFVVKEVTRRPRPYVYHTPAPLVSSLGHNAARSFFSGHAATAFCSAAISACFSGHAGRHRHDRTTWVPLFGICAVSTSLLRVWSGMHFPTDVIAGVITGSLIGYALPEIHDDN